MFSITSAADLRRACRPATNKATFFSLFLGGHGEYPRLVFSPGSIADHFALAFEVFNYAERYQTPVIVLNDKFLANSTQTILPLREDGMVIDRGRLATPEELETAIADGKGFPRFRPDPKRILSARPLPGTEGSPHWLTGDEHDDYGHITENPEIRRKMHEKRMRKYELMLKEIPEDKQYSLHGDPKADLTMVCWGSTLGVLLDAVEVLKERGHNVNFLHIRMLCPFPAAPVTRILKNAKRLALIENNYSGLLGKLITMHTGVRISTQIVKYTGRPMSLTEVLAGIERIIKGEVESVEDPLNPLEKKEKVVLSYGL